MLNPLNQLHQKFAPQNKLVDFKGGSVDLSAFFQSQIKHLKVITLEVDGEALDLESQLNLLRQDS